MRAPLAYSMPISGGWWARIKCVRPVWCTNLSTATLPNTMASPPRSRLGAKPSTARLFDSLAARCLLAERRNDAV